MKSSQNQYVPSHPDMFVVDFAPGDFQSSLKSLKAFKPGETLTLIEGTTKGPKAYTSVQCGPGEEDHVELHSDLVYVNHSCEPNIAFDLSSPELSKWRLVALKPIEVGDSLTFFYPSTEWDMDQAFACTCGMKTCLGSIQGAKYLSKDALDARGYVSPYIHELQRKRDSATP